MLIIAVIVFAIGAMGGLIMAASVLRGQFAPWALSLLHAALGATGLVLVLIAVLHGAKGMVPIALAILVLAALGGFFLASFHWRKQPGPKPGGADPRRRRGDRIPAARRRRLRTGLSPTRHPQTAGMDVRFRVAAPPKSGRTGCRWSQNSRD